MFSCKYCAKYATRTQLIEGKICCGECGEVLDDDNLSEEVTFTEGADGRMRASGNLTSTVENVYSASRERTLSKARDGIEDLMYALGISGGDSIVNPAMRFYELALNRDFTKGRRKELVQAACLYVACRNADKPYLLIDFSEHLKINVYTLGAVFLDLCRVLSLTEHDIVKKTVDPSLFIHRFADRLFGEKKSIVSRTALHIVSSMKRDWMQTGRKPSGLCGAALYISALAHGLKRTKFEVIRVVHISEGTLLKRLIEFENTDSGGLTIDEFNKKALELEEEEKSPKALNSVFKAGELLCQHKGDGKSTHFAHGLCESCYKDFITLSGGLDGGAEPPAFQCAEMARRNAKESEDPRENNNLSGFKDSQTSMPNFTRTRLRRNTARRSNKNGTHDADDTYDESESSLDIDDNELNSYLYNEEEKKYKKIIWEEMNREYLDEQAAKVAAAKAAKEAYETQFANCSEDAKEAHKLAAKTAEAVAKSKKEKQQKRAGLKNKGPARSALEAAKQMLDRKRLSSRIRYEVLEDLFGESETSEITKKSRTEKKDDTIEDSEMDPGVETVEDGYCENVDEYNCDDYNDYENGEDYNCDDYENVEEYRCHDYENVEECNYDDEQTFC